MAVMAGIAAASALANVGVGLAGQARSNAQQQKQYDLQVEQMRRDQENQAYQRMVQQMVNQRAVAGTEDSFGTSIQYDPATNTWKQTLGQLPMAADTAAINANLTRNTTDLMQQELANRVEMDRAAQAGPAADTAQRELANFRPMSADTLTGLLTQQGINAARQAYDPLRADTLRAVARTGTAAGPVIGQLGLSEAKNLRDTLIDAQIKGITGVSDINTANYNRLANAAGTTRGLARPALAQSGLGTSSTDQLLQQLTNVRAQWAPSSTAQGAYGANASMDPTNQMTRAAASSVPNQNFGLDKTISGLKDFSTWAGGSGTNSASGLYDAFKSWFGGGVPTSPSANYDPTSYGATAGGTGTGILKDFGFYNPLGGGGVTNTNQ